MSMRIKSSLKLEKVSKIFHISDVHIRNYKRHAEYNAVFKTLFECIKSNKDEHSLICLTGDIVHSKTDVSPELFDMVQSFIKNLSDICPVLMIPGNHDANLNNSHRLDALTPVVNALNSENVEYVKDSCVVTVGNVDFYHWSVFDEKRDYPKKMKGSENKSVCLYHGCVHHALTDMNFILTNESMKVEDFHEFDMTLLGDIHKPQYLDEKQTVAYPGSLIQQNHGESLNDHGILVWTMSDNSSDFIRIKNEIGFVTLNIQNSVDEEEIDSLLHKTPDNLYLRIKCANLEQSDIKRIVSYIKSKKNVIETSVTKESTVVDMLSIVDSHKIDDFRDINNQNEFIKKYLSEKYFLSEDVIQKIQNINLKTNSELVKLDTPRNIVWTPRYFQFENMFSYGKDNFIDFSSMEGVYGLFAANASGKSTLLDSIMYCVFDKCTKTNKAVQVMNNHCNTFFCKLNFELNGINYFIERNAKREKNGNVRVEVDFYYLNDTGDKVSLNGKDRNDTNASIRNILGTYEDFVLTSMSTQSNNTGFIDMSQKDRKDLLAQFMDINVFEELYNIANESLKEINVLHKEYSKVDHVARILDIDSKMIGVESGIAEYEKSGSLIQDEIEKIEQDIVDQLGYLKKIDLESYDIGSIEASINQIESQVSLLNDDLNSVNQNCEKALYEINDINASLVKYDYESLSNSVKLLNEVKTENANCLINIKKLETDMSHSLKKMDKLQELKYDVNCSFCMDNIFVKDAIETKDRILEDEKTLNDAKKNLKQNEDSIKYYEKYEKQLQEYNNLVSLKVKAQLNMASYEKKITEHSSKIVELDTKKQKLRDKLRAYENQKIDIEHNKSANEKIDLLKIKLASIKSILSTYNNEIIKLNIEKSSLDSSRNQLVDQLNRLKDLQDSKQCYDYYLECMHRNGIPHLLVTKTIPKIETEINNILSQLVDFKITLIADDKNINAYISYNEDSVWPIELTSGMEKFISSLAIRNSLISVSTLPRPNFIAIDEGFGSLDQSSLLSMNMMFEYLKSQFKFIMIVSHIDSMKDSVDKQIEVVKINGRSFIQHK